MGVSSNKNNKLKEKYKDINNIRNLTNKCKSFTDSIEIIKYINCGSYGVVYEGHHRKNPNKKFALKFLYEQKLKKNKSENRTDKEIKFQQQLKHKNITSFNGVYDFNTFSCIVMELAKYGDLENFQKKLLEKKTLNETFLAYLTIQVLDGLYYCYKSKIIHMDIKPQNILIDENLNIKLTDLSVSFSYKDLPENESINLPIAGTSMFISPEILNKKFIYPKDFHKIDFYSLGVVLYYLAFNIYPYGLNNNDKKNFNIIKEKIKNNKFEFPNNNFLFSKYFLDFLSNLLEKNNEKRINFEEAKKHPWIKFSKIILEEKEKINDKEKFLIMLINDDIISFNDAIFS